MAGREPNQIQADLSADKGMFREMKRGIKGLVLGVLTEQDRSIVDAEMLELYDNAIARLEKLGAVLRPLKLPRTIDEMRSLVSTIIAVEGYYYHGDMYENP